MNLLRKNIYLTLIIGFFVTFAVQARTENPSCSGVARAAASNCIGLGEYLNNETFWCSGTTALRLLRAKVTDIAPVSDGTYDYLVEVAGSRFMVTVIEEPWPSKSAKALCEVMEIQEI